MGLKAFRACELPWSVWPLPAPNSWGVSQGREGLNTFPRDSLKPDVQRSLSGVKYLAPIPNFRSFSDQMISMAQHVSVLSATLQHFQGAVPDSAVLTNTSPELVLATGDCQCLAQPSWLQGSL